jgi:hypothetical protein
MTIESLEWARHVSKLGASSSVLCTDLLSPIYPYIRAKLRQAAHLEGFHALRIRPNTEFVAWGFATPGLSSVCLNSGEGREGHGEAVSSLSNRLSGRLGLDLAAKTLCNRVAWSLITGKFRNGTKQSGKDRFFTHRLHRTQPRQVPRSSFQSGIVVLEDADAFAPDLPFDSRPPSRPSPAARFDDQKQQSRPS